MQVVDHDGELVHAAADFLQVKVLVELRLGGQRSGQQKTGTNGIELAAKFSGHRGEIAGVLGKTRARASFHRILPVNINAVEDSGHMDARRKISPDKCLHTRVHELAHVLGLSGAGKALRLAPSAKRDDDFQFGKTALQLLKLMESAPQPVGTSRVGCAVNTLRLRVGVMDSGLDVGNLALIVLNPAKCVVERGKPGCSTTGDNILHG